MRAINILLIELLLGQFLEETTSEWVLDGRGKFRWLGLWGQQWLGQRVLQRIYGCEVGNEELSFLKALFFIITALQRTFYLIL